MGMFEKFGGALGAFSNNDFERGWEMYVSGLDALFELFKYDSGNGSPRRLSLVSIFEELFQGNIGSGLENRN